MLINIIIILQWVWYIGVKKCILRTSRAYHFTGAISRKGGRMLQENLKTRSILSKILHWQTRKSNVNANHEANMPTSTWKQPLTLHSHLFLKLKDILTWRSIEKSPLTSPILWFLKESTLILKESTLIVPMWHLLWFLFWFHRSL